MARRPRQSDQTEAPGKPPRTLKITVPHEVARQIQVEAMARDLSPSQLILDVWLRTPRQFALHRLSRRPGEPIAPTGPDQLAGDGPRLAEAS